MSGDAGSVSAAGTVYLIRTWHLCFACILSFPSQIAHVVFGGCPIGVTFTPWGIGAAAAAVVSATDIAINAAKSFICRVLRVDRSDSSLDVCSRVRALER